MKGKRFEKTKKVKSKEKRNTKKIGITIMIVIILIAIIGGIVYFAPKWIKEQQERKEEKRVEAQIQENVSNITQEKEYQGMQIKNIQVYEENGNTYFVAEVENTSQENFTKKNVTISFVTKQNELVAKFRYHMSDMKVGEKQEINIVTNNNLKEAYDFQIQD